MPAASKTTKKTVKKAKTKQKSIKNSFLGKIKKKLQSIFESIFWYFFSRKFVVFLWILFICMILCYILLFFSAARIQALITFPGRDINLKEITNHPAGLIVIEYFYSDIQLISDLWYSVIAHEYPWYGEATGMPYIEENRNFSQIFYENMQQELWFKDTDVIIWGYSVGTALAVDFAQNRDFDSLVLFAPFASLYDMSEKVFWFPLQKLFFLENSYISKEVIKTIDEPTLIIHGNSDTVVPVEQWKLVYENSAAERKKFIEIDWFGHSLIPERYGDVLSPYIQDFLSDNLPSPKTEVFLDTDLALTLLEKYQKQSRIENLDFTADSSLTKYVDPRISFTEVTYVPSDLRRLEREYIIDSKWNAQMRSQAADAVEEMAQAFYNDFNEKMLVVSSYRSYSYQAGIKARWCPDNLCAKAGHSEHQSGLAVDFWSASSQQVWDNSQRLTWFYKWLEDNAHLYGFHNGYRNGVEIDGYDVEPWHWRYVGREFAEYLHTQNITFAQYYYGKNRW